MKFYAVTFYIAIATASVSRYSPSGCGKALLPGQSYGAVSNVTVRSGGQDRSYLISIPPSYNADIPTPVILSYHGGNRDAEDQLKLDELTKLQFNAVSFVIYPQGINQTWQGVPNVTTNDIQFTTDILDQIQSRYCIDPERISATGKSDGAGFCNVLACDPILSSRLAAFAPVSGAYYIDTLPCDAPEVYIPCASSRQNIPLLAFHGGNDTTIPYTGGERKEQCLPTIPHFVREWALRDGLGLHNVTATVASHTVSYKYGYRDSFGLVEHIFDSVIGHDWPSTAPNADNQESGHHIASFNATPIILDFFRDHPLDNSKPEHGC